MDYSEPLIELREWERKYAEGMRNKHPEQAKVAAMKMIRLVADLLEIAEGK
jgi:hypothetical protein